jgi:hypothetical protein
MSRKQHPKRSLSELKARELRHIVGEIQKTLWLEEYADDEQRSTGSGVHTFWNAAKERDCPSLLSEIATVLEDHGLRPIDPPIVQGFDSIDEFIEALPKPPPNDFDAQWNAALLNTPVADDYGDSEDPEDWTPHARPTS